MLHQILSSQTCADCRLCCGFDRTDLWELPILPPETVDAIHAMEQSPVLVPAGTEQTFAAPELQGDTLFQCPMLGEAGCSMGTKKPFDCQIWPFRMMRDASDAVRIAVASYCSGMERYTDAQLHEFLSQGLAQKILEYAAQHPSHIKPFSEQYRMIW